MQPRRLHTPDVLRKQFFAFGERPAAANALATIMAAAHTRSLSSDAIRGFTPVSAEILSRRALLRRIDSKFLVPLSRIEELLPAVSRDYGVLYAGDEALPTYHTLYFDTPELLCFHDHRRGRRARHKVRVRHYPERHLSYLEVKTKRSALITDKQRMKRTYGVNALGGEGIAFVARHSSLPAYGLEPQMWTYFRRLTLVGLRTSERLTIDVDLAFRREAHTTWHAVTGVAIVEVKQSPFCVRTPIMCALRRSGFRPVSASKYCTGTLLLRSGLRCNRLLPAIRELERTLDSERTSS